MGFIQGHTPAGVVSTLCSTTEVRPIRKRGIVRTEVVRTEVVNSYGDRGTCSCPMCLIKVCHNALCVQTLNHQTGYVAVHLTTNRTTGRRKIGYVPNNSRFSSLFLS